jgi:hypothetical protein
MLAAAVLLLSYGVSALCWLVWTADQGRPGRLSAADVRPRVRVVRVRLYDQDREGDE